MILRVLKAELEYFSWFILLIIVLPLIFSFATFGDIQFFRETFFLNKYFWSVLIGLGLYGIVFAIWGFRKKELRERVHSLLPFATTSRAISRWLFGILPFLIVGFYTELHHGAVSSSYEIFIDRINGQLGMMFIALAGIDLMLNVWNSININHRIQKILFTATIGTIILTSTIVFVYAVTTKVFKPITFGGEEIYFFIWAIVLSLISTFTYTKRKFYLE